MTYDTVVGGIENFCEISIRGVFHQAFCQCFSLTTIISYWNPCIWLAESKFVSEKHWQNAWWNAPLKSRHAKCVRSAWPECIDSVARCGSSITCASMELARCGSSSTCARYGLFGATIFPVCLAFQGRKISLILSSFSFWRKNHTNQR